MESQERGGDGEDWGTEQGHRDGAGRLLREGGWRRVGRREIAVEERKAVGGEVREEAGEGETGKGMWLRRTKRRMSGRREEGGGG